MASSSKPNPNSASHKSSRTPKPTTAPKSPESFHSLNERNNAAEILQSYEKLSWFSMQRCESLTQTRLHFQNIVAGFTADDEAKLVDWMEDLTPRGEVAKKGGGKGKERVNEVGAAGLGGGGGGGVTSGSGSAKKKRKSDGKIVS